MSNQTQEYSYPTPEEVSVSLHQHEENVRFQSALAFFKASDSVKYFSVKPIHVYDDPSWRATFFVLTFNDVSFSCSLPQDNSCQFAKKRKEAHNSLSEQLVEYLTTQVTNAEFTSLQGHTA